MWQLDLTISLRRYNYNGPVDHKVAPGLKPIKGKSVIMTGGANGMGANVTFADQKAIFEKAISQSLSKSVDVVIANAGISRSSGDSSWTLDDPKGGLTKPDLNIVRVNLDGALYTWKLAVHDFWKQQVNDERDRRSGHEQNYWIKSDIRIAEYRKWLLDLKCMLRIATDKSIDGRSFMITRRSVEKEGFVDMDREDYKDVPDDQYLKQLQAS
ncbi:hypothetical protein BKA56DRAFT_629537 [Ilyonectria sp. MPI-CAGE-AT-0026]|nr:hypothetical protein BKA56DRAFT_629537 [Ilyonectria sp. MPI-CAGE-AT-0026]